MIVELTHSDAQSFQFPIRYALSRTATDGAFLMVGHDLRPIAELQQQLVQAQLSLDDIAANLGYSEQSSFGRAFRRWTGTTPLLYRRSLEIAGEARA